MILYKKLPFVLVLSFFLVSVTIKAQTTNEYVINENVKWLKAAIEKHSMDVYSPSFNCTLFQNARIPDADPEQLFYYNINTQHITISQKIYGRDVQLTDNEVMDKSYIFYPNNGKYYLNPGIRIKITKYESVYSFDLPDIDTSAIKITELGEIIIPTLSNITTVSRKIIADCKVFIQKKDTVSSEEYDFISYRMPNSIFELNDSIIENCNNNIKFSETANVSRILILIDNAGNNRKLVVRALKNLYKFALKKPN